MSNKAGGHGVFSGMFSVIFAFGLSRGLSIEEMAAAIGVSPVDIMDPNRRIPDHKLLALWALVDSDEDDITATLNLATAAPLSIFAGLAEGARFAGTLGIALEHIAQNGAILADRLKIGITDSAGKIVVSLNHPLDTYDRGRFSSLGVLLLKRLVEEVLGVQDALASARLMRTSVSSPEKLVDYFGCEVYFGQPVNEIHLYPSGYDQPINHANTELFAFVQSHFSMARDALETMTSPEGLHRLRDAIVENALKSDYTAQSAAQTANLSLRSAQRLALSGDYTLQKLIDDVRFENAKMLLRNPELTTNEISEALSYSDDRSFRRAFKRVVGLSPSEYRQSVSTSGGVRPKS